MPDLATDLLLIGRDPATGRLRNRVALEKGLRAALFAQLVLPRLLVNHAGTPHATTRDGLGDRVLDTILVAVADRPGVLWRRWYHHVGADRDVLSTALIDRGRWTCERDRFGRTSWRDNDQDATLALTFTIDEIAALRKAPDGHEQAILAVLSTMCGSIVGRPRPREFRRRLAPLLDLVGAPSDPMRRDLQAALVGCSWAIRHRRRVLP